MKSFNYEEILNSRDKQNLALIIGSSGAGKSSLVNHLIGREVANVSHVGVGTQKTEGYSLSDKLMVIDTRGTDELGAIENTWQNIKDLIINLAPNVIIWCMDGSLRKELDMQFVEIEDMLEGIFARTRLDPKICIIANKMDMIEPAGFEFLPDFWPNLRTEKGRNINARISQINSLFSRLCKTEACLIEPTCLEWYQDAEPWNFKIIRNCLIDGFSKVPSDVLKNLSLSQDMFQKLIAIQVRAVELDIENDQGNYVLQKKKRQWLASYKKKANYEPIDLNKIGIFPTEPLLRNILLQNLLLFVPYIPFSSDEKDIILYDQRSFIQIVEKILTIQFRISIGEIKDFREDFETIEKSLRESLFNLGNAGKIGLVGLLAGSGMWFFAPAVGTWIGASLFGFHGVVATNAGLAWLGLGSLAAGGFGMFGGTVVLVGSAGMLAAATSGVAIVAMSSMINVPFARQDSTKMVQNFRILLSCAKKDPARKQEVLDMEKLFSQTIENLRVSLKTEVSNKDNLRKGIEIYLRARNIMTTERLAANIKFCRETR